MSKTFFYFWLTVKDIVKEIDMTMYAVMILRKLNTFFFINHSLHLPFF